MFQTLGFLLKGFLSVEMTVYPPSNKKRATSRGGPSVSQLFKKRRSQRESLSVSQIKGGRRPLVVACWLKKVALFIERLVFVSKIMLLQ